MFIVTLIDFLLHFQIFKIKINSFMKFYTKTVVITYKNNQFSSNSNLNYGY